MTTIFTCQFSKSRWQKVHLWANSYTLPLE